jgi:hypothetical protein
VAVQSPIRCREMNEAGRHFRHDRRIRGRVRQHFVAVGNLGQRNYRSMLRQQEISTGQARVFLELMTDYGLAPSFLERAHGPVELRRVAHRGKAS